MTALLSVENLVIHAHALGKDHPIVRNVSFDVMPGEVVGLIGESGSGKSTIGLACLGYVRPGLYFAGGNVSLAGNGLLDLDPIAKRRARGKHGAYVPQSAAAAFNPALRINRQVVEAQVFHAGVGRSVALSQANNSFEQLGLPNPTTIGLRYPHEVSGGQLQRLAAAMAFAAGPKLVVFDEPTTALDVTTQIGVLHAFRETLKKSKAAAIYITHDLAVVAQVADRIIVLASGEIVEQGFTDQILQEPRHPLTKNLLAASKPSQNSNVPQDFKNDIPLLSLQSVSATYRRGEKSVISHISLQMMKGEIVAVVGESGSGKSTLARAIAGLAPYVGGKLIFHGRPLHLLGQREKQSLRQIQLVMQSADTTLNPKQRVEDILSRPLKHFQLCQAHEINERNIRLLERVRLPSQVMGRLSSELSGGQKQRLNLARALAAEPDLVLCDEITSALDVVTRLEIVELLRSIRDELGTSFLFITHDLLTAASLADRIIVMRNGTIVEEGPSVDVLSRPKEIYTQELIKNIPKAERGWLTRASSRAISV